jgi:hypothetical protein
MIVFSVLGVLALVLLLVVLPAVLVLRDLRSGRPDPGFHDPSR